MILWAFRKLIVYYVLIIVPHLRNTYWHSYHLISHHHLCKFGDHSISYWYPELRRDYPRYFLSYIYDFFGRDSKQEEQILDLSALFFRLKLHICYYGCNLSIIT